VRTHSGKGTVFRVKYGQERAVGLLYYLEKGRKIANILPFNKLKGQFFFWLFCLTTAIYFQPCNPGLQFIPKLLKRGNHWGNQISTF